MKPFTKRLGARLRAVRLETGMSQHTLATELGTEQCAVSRYEAGVRCPTVWTLQAFASAFNMTLSQLLEGV